MVEKKTYTVFVSWEMYGHIEVQANSVEEAMKEAETGENIFLPPDGSYVEDSFQVDYDATVEVPGGVE